MDTAKLKKELVAYKLFLRTGSLDEGYNESFLHYVRTRVTPQLNERIEKEWELLKKF